jgi:hypothetical protein
MTKKQNPLAGTKGPFEAEMNLYYRLNYAFVNKVLVSLYGDN